MPSVTRQSRLIRVGNLSCATSRAPETRDSRRRPDSWFRTSIDDLRLSAVEVCQDPVATSSGIRADVELRERILVSVATLSGLAQILRTRARKDVEIVSQAKKQKGFKRVGPPLLVASSSMLLLAACGSSSANASSSKSATPTTAASSSSGSGSSSSSVAKAAAQLAKYTGTKPATPPGPAFNDSKAAGKLVWLVSVTTSTGSAGTQAQMITADLESQHVKVLGCDAHGVSTNLGSCIRQGLSHNPAAIIVNGGDPQAYSSATQAANAAHVPVISELDVPVPYSPYTSKINAHLQGIAADAAPPDPISGTLAADFVVKDSNGHANVLFISSPGILGGTYEELNFQATMKQLCPSCNIYTKGVTIPNWTTDIGPTVSAELRLHPNINYVVPVFDPMAAWADPAIIQAGKASSVKVVSVNGDLQQMKNLAQGQVIVCDVGQDYPEMAFQATDEALRYLSGVSGSSLVKAVAPGVRVFTSQNIKSVSLTNTAFENGAWYTGSSTALANMYHKLWSGS